LVPDRRVAPRTGLDDATPDARGVVGMASYLTRRFLARRAEGRGDGRRG
jgi:hypothetical protein